MKKTATILTIRDYKNHGNRLQNYAVQTVLEKRGCDVVSADFEGKPCKFGYMEEIKYRLYAAVGFRVTRHREYWEQRYAIASRFKAFNDKYIKSEEINQISDLQKRDFYVVGSDQVWNPIWYEYSDIYRHIYLLDFTEPEKRVCMAPSFGTEDIPEKWKPWFCENLVNFPMLSVREEAGARIIKELTGREATVLPDPTMLLTVEEWRKISHRPRKAKNGYILTYFLSPKGPDAEACLAQIGEGRRVYRLRDFTDPVAGSVGPSEFLWLFDHADLILTDSFHGCVFSFLFNKPFVVFNRNLKGLNMNSRMDTLLKKFRLERKFASSGLENDIWEHDYSEGYRVLEQEREKANDFLNKALRE